jgi:hypothetical protein
MACGVVAPRACGVGLSIQPCCSFSVWWLGEASQELVVQSADVSALPGILPHQAGLQLLVKVPGSQRSEGQWLCSGLHLGSPTTSLKMIYDTMASEQVGGQSLGCRQ